MKAKKRKLADVRVHACARGEQWGGASQTRLVFFDSPRVLRDTGRLLRKLYWRGIWDVEVWFYLYPLKKNFILDHFEDILEMVSIGSGAKRPLESVKLSRYACYLIVQNADPSKEVVANGQTYFAIQTRIAEIKQMDEYNRLSSEEEKRLFLRNELARHNSQLADAAKNAGVIESRDYAIFQNHGYQGLYGGLDAKA